MSDRLIKNVTVVETKHYANNLTQFFSCGFLNRGKNERVVAGQSQGLAE